MNAARAADGPSVAAGIGAPDTRRLLEAATALSRRFGEDPQFTRAGGGNSSVKDAETLYVKASGEPLASITPSSLMPLAIAPLRALGPADRGRPGDVPPGSDAVMRVAMGARQRDEGERRPSVECVFHALIPRRFVIHTHPTIVNAIACARDGEQVAADLFGDTILWVPYVDPGLPLAHEIVRRRLAWAERSGGAGAPPTLEPAEAMLLQSHGLIVAGDEPEAITARSYEVVEAIRRRLGQAWEAIESAGRNPDPDLVDRVKRTLGRRLGALGRERSIAFDGLGVGGRLAAVDEGRSLVKGGPLTPDQIVYAGSWPLWLELHPAAREDGSALEAEIVAALAAHEAATGEQPIVVVVRDVGVFASGAGPHQAETALQLYLDATRIGFGALALGGVRTLQPREREFIEDWEAEAYRRGVGSAAADRTGP
jgi:rhamnulokinase